MRKIYTSITVLAVSILTLAGCHSNQKSAPNTATNVVGKLDINGFNNRIQYDCEVISIERNKAIKPGLTAIKTFDTWHKTVTEKYPIPKNGFNVFDHSHAKEQAFLMNSLYKVFYADVPASKYGIPTKLYNFISTFEEKSSVWMTYNQCSSLKYDPTVAGHDIKALRGTVAVLDGMVTDFTDALDAVLDFDYTRFGKQWTPEISRFWSQVYSTNVEAHFLKKYVNSLKHDLWLVDFKEGY